MTTLAEIDLKTGLMLLQLAITIVLALITGVLTSKTRKIESQEKRLHEMADKLIDERMRRISHEFDNHAQGLVLAIDEMKDRLNTRDGIVASLGERDHTLELKVLSQLHDIKTFVVEKAASKDDLKAHEQSVSSKFDRVSDRLTQIERKVH